MHREDAAFWAEVIGDREDALLHFTRVLRAENDELLVLNAEVDARGGTHPGGELVRRKRTRVHDHEIRLAEAGELFLARADEHGVHEERVVGPRADHADLDARARVPTGKSVE